MDLVFVCRSADGLACDVQHGLHELLVILARCAVPIIVLFILCGAEVSLTGCCLCTWVKGGFYFIVSMLPLACADWDWILVSVIGILLGGSIGALKTTV